MPIWDRAPSGAHTLYPPLSHALVHTVVDACPAATISLYDWALLWFTAAYGGVRIYSQFALLSYTTGDAATPNRRQQEPAAPQAAEVQRRSYMTLASPSVPPLKVAASSASKFAHAAPGSLTQRRAPSRAFLPNSLDDPRVTYVDGTRFAPAALQAAYRHPHTSPFLSLAATTLSMSNQAIQAGTIVMGIYVFDTVTVARIANHPVAADTPPSVLSVFQSHLGSARHLGRKSRPTCSPASLSRSSRPPSTLISSSPMCSSPRRPPTRASEPLDRREAGSAERLVPANHRARQRSRMRWRGEAGCSAC